MNDEKTWGWGKNFFRPGECSKWDRNTIADLGAGDSRPDRLDDSRTFTSNDRRKHRLLQLKGDRCNQLAHTPCEQEPHLQTGRLVPKLRLSLSSEPDYRRHSDEWLSFVIFSSLQEIPACERTTCLLD